jgi:nucleotide-binding universal stress UspA family protein
MDARAESPFHVLVPTDGTVLAERALDYAVAVSPRGTSFHLIGVVPTASSLGGSYGSSLVSDRPAGEPSTVRAMANLQRAITMIPDRRAVEAELVAGDPATIIVQTAVQGGVDLIVIASHGRGAAARWLFGSVADRVARDAPVPVMIVNPSESDSGQPLFKRVIVPDDGSDLAAAAYPVAIDLARRLRVAIHIVRVINPQVTAYPVMAMGSPLSDSVYLQVLEDEKSAALAELKARIDSLNVSDIVVTSQLLVGPVVPAIEGALTEGDLVVISSHGRGGLKRLLLGSVAEALIHDAAAPVVLAPVTGREASGERGAGTRMPS